MSEEKFHREEWKEKRKNEIRATSAIWEIIQLLSALLALAMCSSRHKGAKLLADTRKRIVDAGHDRIIIDVDCLNVITPPRLRRDPKQKQKAQQHSLHICCFSEQEIRSRHSDIVDNAMRMMNRRIEYAQHASISISRRLSVKIIHATKVLDLANQRTREVELIDNA